MPELRWGWRRGLDCFFTHYFELLGVRIRQLFCIGLINCKDQSFVVLIGGLQ